ncbi:cephalosporin-C deacetylase [Kribbella aluminosa]|uniref:Cephalosporin-C deacetylase n=1 Tax=Kribbella aluminosa TaxID=416017 RepID=A0ABS4UX61_9ACTN|nr:acetylxylan esterase [Kribbella aluminosa]MBP2356109.1 cephalosporin-C deacetylase [Kribbella aluminosa]
MSQYDLPLNELAGYRGALPEPTDFDAFWSGTMHANAHPSAVTAERVETPWSLIDAYDITFAGYGGAPIKAWLTVPAGADTPRPAVVTYHGHTRGRAFPHTDLLWAVAGYAHLSVDTRGQGSGSGGPGSGSPDPDVAAGLPHAPGYLTLGVEDPATFFYRRVFVDAARVLAAAAELPYVDAGRIVVHGASQGGGIALAAAALARHVGVSLRGVGVDVPYLCAFPRSIRLVDTHPYNEVTKYLAAWRDREETVYRTLSYFDGALLGQRAEAPALFSVGLMDLTCPPSSVYAAFNRYGSLAAPEVEKTIKVYGHNGHEGGGDYQTLAQAEFFQRVAAR